MNLDKLRYSLTKHTERFFFTQENSRLLIHPSITNYRDLLNKIDDNIELMPEINKTQDNITIKFYKFNYNDELYFKSELLSFVFAAIDSDWNIVKGIYLSTGKTHFWLKHDTIVFDPSLAIITNESLYSKKFKQLNEIKNEDVKYFLIKNNNLYKFYKKESFENFQANKNHNFSINFINTIIEQFNKNINTQFILNKEKIEHIKRYIMLNDFIELRQVLTQKRKSYLQSNKIAVHPSIDNSILEIIEKASKNIYDLMNREYNVHVDYHNATLGNCYALSILLNLYNGDFKLIQGGILYQEHTTNHFYQHSWLEKDNIVYDPALRIITPKVLYYTFVQKQDEYSKEDTENILRRIGFNLTHFRDFINGTQIGNNETIRYRYSVNKIDSPEMKEKGEKLISLIKSLKRK